MGEKVEVVAWSCGNFNPLANLRKREPKGFAKVIPLMTVAQHERIVADMSGLLRIAVCPNEDCVDGGYHGPHGEPHQCQWCAERDAFLAQTAEGVSGG